MGLFSSVGKFLNDVTGSSSAGAQSQKYNIQAMRLQNEFQKEFAQNAHQWEAEDLMKAGYNPALTTGLGGASAGGAGGGSGATVSAGGTDLIGMLGGIANIYNSTSATKAQNKLAKAETDLKTAQAIKQIMDNKVFKKFGMDTQKHILMNLIKTGGQIDAQTLLTNEMKNTEWSKQENLSSNSAVNWTQASLNRIASHFQQNDLDMLEKYGISRTELKELIRFTGDKIVELAKAGKYSEIAKIYANNKNRIEPFLEKKGKK